VIPIGDYPNPRSPQWVTRILVGLNVAIYLFLSLPLDRPLNAEELRDPAIRRQIEDIAERESRDPRLILRQITRYDLVIFRYGYTPGKPSLLSIFTCMFLHAGFMHVAGNMLMLWIFGDNVEARLGRLGYLLTYLGTGVLATLAFSLFASGSKVPLVGASGAISGVLGCYLIWFPRNQIRVLILFFYFFYFIYVRAIWVLLIFFVWENLLPFLLESKVGAGSGVAHGAHIGGFLAGMLVAFLYDLVRGRAPRPTPLPEVERRRAPWSPPPRPVPGAAADAFHGAVRMGRMEDAAHAFTRHATEGGPPPAPDDVFALGRWLYENDFAQDAVAVFRYYISHYPRGDDLDRVHLGLGVLLARRLSQPAAAREHLLMAIDLARDPSLAAKAREELSALG
jgi:membrane associated rhomboid family serine protease